MAQPSLRRSNRFHNTFWPVGLVLLVGCSSLHTKPERDYRTVQASPNRDTARAEKLHAKALKLVARCEHCTGCECIDNAVCKPCKAEKLLQDALIADVRYGPAHNTLGTLYLQQRKLYLAAWEFEYATGLMPERPEPLYNLGMVYEEAGRLGQAIVAYEQAYEIDPTNAEYIGNLARVSLKQGVPLNEVRYLLRELRLYDTRPGWIAWAEDLMGTNPDPNERVSVFDEPGGMASPENVPSLGGPELLPEPDVGLVQPGL
ncbi:MAG: tetratricopeptide repeat protein [Planctomycetota bacterium]